MDLFVFPERLQQHHHQPFIMTSNVEQKRNGNKHEKCRNIVPWNHNQELKQFLKSKFIFFFERKCSNGVKRPCCCLSLLPMCCHILHESRLTSTMLPSWASGGSNRNLSAACNNIAKVSQLLFVFEPQTTLSFQAQAQTCTQNQQ